MRRPRAVTAAPLLLLALVWAPPAQAEDAEFDGISEDGSVAVFSTKDQLVSGDTDIQRDIYVRDHEEGKEVTREVSLGPTGGNDAYPAEYLAVSPDGTEVFFATKERLVAADTDRARDIYVRDLAENKTRLVSAGDTSCAASECGNGEVDVSPVPGGVVDEGRKVFFVTTESLSPADTDNGADIYVRNLATETTTLVTAPAPSCSSGCGAGTGPVVFQGASADGSKAIFTASESFAGEDADTEFDLYERNLESGTTSLVSKPGPGPEACPTGLTCTPSTASISADGSHVFYETDERVVAGDEDGKQDVYDWSGGTPALASVGPGGENGTGVARFLAASADGSSVFFATADELVGADTDSAVDVYVRSGGTTELVSAGDSSCAASECGNGGEAAELEWISPDGHLAILSTAEPLVAGDEDSSADVYARHLPGGPTELVSLPAASCSDPECGNGDHNASFAGASADGAHLFFVTEEALAPPVPEGDPTAFGDSDEATDVYEFDAGAVRLISLGQRNAAEEFRGNGDFPAQLHGVSTDGGTAYFTSKEQLTEADEDTYEDVYVRTGVAVLLVSRKNGSALEGELAPSAPSLERTSPESPASSTDPRVIGSDAGAPEALVKLYPTVDCTGEPVATGSVAQLEAPGIAVHVELESTIDLYATAEANGFVSGCSGKVSYRQHSEEAGGRGPHGSEEEEVERIRLPVPTPPAESPFKYVTPQTRITFGPAFKTRLRRPVFRFTDTTGQPGTRFTCRVDRHRWRTCSSPVKLPKLHPGKHVFRVKGENAIGAWEAQPSSRAFKLVRSARKRKHTRHVRRGGR